jgi:oxalate decarboxylase/phosphoglucose isomerase-like protein (cupin superfamily)
MARSPRALLVSPSGRKSPVRARSLPSPPGVITVAQGAFLLVPPNTAHVFCTPGDTGVDMLFLMPGAERFEYFRLGERIQQGKSSPQELLESQDRFDNHFLDSPVWRRFRGSPTTPE